MELLVLMLSIFGSLFLFNEILNWAINRKSNTNMKDKLKSTEGLDSEAIASLYALSAKLDKGDVISITTDKKEDKKDKKSDLEEILSDDKKNSSPEPSWLNEYQEMVSNDNGIIDVDKDGIDDGVEATQDMMNN